MAKILVTEISGKRPGTTKQRPTEKMPIEYDHLIISNNSEGYETTWDIVNVPGDYVEWYKANVKTSDNAWYAPMNRSYAIKYAREHGYDYLVQLDDNIVSLELCYLLKDGNMSKKYRIRRISLINDYIDMMACVLDNTNAGLVGCQLQGTAGPAGIFLAERYCYSLFMLNLHVCPDLYHGDFEDDIEFRLKCTEMGLPTIQIVPMRYGKTGQKSSKDESGNRAAYTAAGPKRGEHMRLLHGDVYSCGYNYKTASFWSTDVGKYFKHKVKTFKIGVCVKNMDAIKEKFSEILLENAEHHEDRVVVKP